MNRQNYRKLMNRMLNGNNASVSFAIAPAMSNQAKVVLRQYNKL